VWVWVGLLWVKSIFVDVVFVVGGGGGGVVGFVVM